MSMVQITLIETDEALAQAAEEWRRAKVLGLDLECENNLHHYGVVLSLVQVSTTTHSWVVDMLRIKNPQPLVQILEDRSIQKIFHDVGFDFRVLKKMLNCHPWHVFDTQVAAIFLGMTELGLGSLLQKHFGVKKEEKLQTCDWLKRPLTPVMLEYAASDTTYLIPLKELLEKELRKQERWNWVREEFAHLEDLEFPMVEQTYLDISGVKLLSPTHRNVAKELFHLREKIARQVDRPVYFIFNNKLLVHWAEHPPRMVDEWKRMQRVHPAVRYQARELVVAVEKGLAAPVEELVRSKPQRLTQQQRDALAALTDLRTKVAQNMGIKPHLLGSKEQLLQYTVTSSGDVFRPWQRELLKL